MRVFVLSASFVVISAGAWFTGTAIGDHLAAIRLQRVTAGLPQIEMLSQQIAATLHQQGVCLDAPVQDGPSHTATPPRMEKLQARLAVQSPCLDLAIAQQQFETLQIETATVQWIHQKQMLTAGFVTDSLRYRAHAPHQRPLRGFHLPAQ